MASRVCQRFARVGDVIDRPCPECDHIMVLHSLHRMCAACEAIITAEQAALEAVAQLTTDPTDAPPADDADHSGD